MARYMHVLLYSRMLLLIFLLLTYNEFGNVTTDRVSKSWSMHRGVTFSLGHAL